MDDLQPSPREPRILDQTVDPPAISKDPVRLAVQTYAEMRPELRGSTERFVALVTTLLDDAGINYLSVTGRAKSVASFAARADRAVAGRPVFTDPLVEITDQIGLRVITYLHSDVAAVADLLADQITVLDDRDMGQETASGGRFGYASRHLLVALDPTRSAPAAYAPLRDRSAQVQVRTVLQHAWAEFEHDIRYKGTIPEEHAPDLERRFTLTAGLLELADRVLQDPRQAAGHHDRPATSDQRPEPDASDPRISGSADQRISAKDLATFLGRPYADAGCSRTDRYAWISGLLLELGITSLDDALLAVFGNRYLGLHKNAHREALLRTRPEELRTPTENPDL